MSPLKRMGNILVALGVLEIVLASLMFLLEWTNLVPATFVFLVGLMFIGLGSVLKKKAE